MQVKYCTAIFIMLFTFSSNLFAQTETPKPPSREERFAKLEPKMIYPIIKGSMMTGVIPVENINNKPAADQKAHLIFDFTQSTANNAQASHVNEGLEEVARVMNLHIAAGYKKEHLKTVIIFHSGSILSILNDDYYQKKYSSSNPNKDLFEQFVKAGTELVVCGQSINLRELGKKELLPAIQIAFSAKTTLTKYQSMGYQVFTIDEK